MVKRSQPLRTAAWAMLAGFLLTALLLASHPQVAAAIAAASRHLSPSLAENPPVRLTGRPTRSAPGKPDGETSADRGRTIVRGRSTDRGQHQQTQKTPQARPHADRSVSERPQAGPPSFVPLPSPFAEAEGAGTISEQRSRPAVELGGIEQSGGIEDPSATTEQQTPARDADAGPRPSAVNPRPFPNERSGRSAASAGIDASPTAAGSASFDVSARLAALERKIDRLAQSDSDDKIDELERATRLLEERQRAGRLRELERRLQELQTGSSTNGGPGLNSSATASGTTPKKSVLRANPERRGDDRFSLQIQDADVKEVLEMLGQMAGLNVLVGKDVSGTVPSANLENVTIEEALDGIVRSLGLAYERDDNFVFVMTEAEQKARRQLSRKIISKVYRPNYIAVNDLLALITPLLTPDVGKAAVTPPNEVGIPLDQENTGGDRLSQTDALLVMDYPEVIQEVDALVDEMDVPPLQVVIEAMILSVQLTDAMDFGVNFALLNGNSNHLAVSGNGRTLNNSSGFPGVDDESIVPPMGNFLADAAGLKFGFLRGDISGFIEALETISDTNLIASPQLRVLNKQRAQLIIGDRLSFTTRTFSDNQIIEDVNFIDAGTKLIIRPFISEDGLVRMEVHPERSSANINPQTGLPDLRTTEVTTNVMVRDGTTVVIGGLITEQVEESFDRVPFLGALPVLGHAFRNKSESIDRSELIVLITPRIVRAPEAELEGQTLRYENERRADFFRNHLSPINRRNLARMEYERARHYFDQGRYLKAREHIERSLEHAKNNTEALRLHEMIEDAIGETKRRWLKFPIPSVWPAERGVSPKSRGRRPAKDGDLPPLPN